MIRERQVRQRGVPAAVIAGNVVAEINDPESTSILLCTCQAREPHRHSGRMAFSLPSINVSTISRATTQMCVLHSLAPYGTRPEHRCQFGLVRVRTVIGSFQRCCPSSLASLALLQHLQGSFCLHRERTVLQFALVLRCRSCNILPRQQLAHVFTPSTYQRCGVYKT